ncbi:hypothetical protein FDP41_005208 [Naegleria fowleri]|uniref:EF-hand domain-containing protein n=1 Tax=Naegleria fowleri TaxID=5763 RepID=A0A6A5BNM4_NAEFO|nr:uncharacterized protein FDP41_005208 [Naegleria fowleri]KAF0975881.1 hypothetical protein FDP41_005208 [Naegleria fowleri]
MMRNNLSKSPPPNNMQSSRNEATIINDDLGSEDAQDTCINDGQVPVETKEAQIGRIRATFGILDCNKDKKLDANDLSKVLRKLRAPKEYLDSVDVMIWEVCDNNSKNYLVVSDLEEIVQRVKEEKKTSFIPDRLVNIIDFVSKDRKLTGYITASQCILLLHNRFGDNLKSVKLRNLFINSRTGEGNSKISFKEFLSQVNIRKSLK